MTYWFFKCRGGGGGAVCFVADSYSPHWLRGFLSTQSCLPITDDNVDCYKACCSFNWCPQLCVKSFAPFIDAGPCTFWGMFWTALLRRPFWVMSIFWLPRYWLLLMPCGTARFSKCPKASCVTEPLVLPTTQSFTVLIALSCHIQIPVPMSVIFFDAPILDEACPSSPHSRSPRPCSCSPGIIMNREEGIHWSRPSFTSA